VSLAFVVTAALRAWRGGCSGVRMLVRRWWICRFPQLHRWDAADLGPR
jgi:hypothetical protein